MTKESSAARSATKERKVRIGGTSSTNGAKVKFGQVIITGSKPSRDLVKVNIERSTKALERVKRKLTTPGITIRAKKDVPLFSVAEGETDVFVRRLNGRVERGRVVDGTFKVID